MYPDAFIDQVRDAVSIVDLIGGCVRLKKQTSSWVGLCPFHDERTASFTVREQPPRYHCFGCHADGDVFSFVMAIQQVEFVDALKLLAAHANIPLPDDSGGNERARRTRDIVGAIEAAASAFETWLFDSRGAAARRYLHEREITDATIRALRIGASLDAWDAILQKLSVNFHPDMLMEAGLLSESTGRRYDRFRNRVMLPIADHAGRVVGFAGRSIDSAEPKYLNSPETPAYSKSRVLYGLHLAAHAIKQADRVIIVEGYLDVARCYQAGFREAVALCGTSLTSHHVRALARHTRAAVISLDGDAAGRSATARIIEPLVAAGIDARVVDLPDGQDPDSFIRVHGTVAYGSLVDDAKPAIDWATRRAIATHGAQARQEIAAELRPLIGAAPSMVQAVELIEQAAGIAGIDPQALHVDSRKDEPNAEFAALLRKLYSDRARVRSAAQALLSGDTDKARAIARGLL